MTKKKRLLLYLLKITQILRPFLKFLQSTTKKPMNFNVHRIKFVDTSSRIDRSSDTRTFPDQVPGLAGPCMDHGSSNGNNDEESTIPIKE